jgi:hypothetical protein
LNSRPLMAVLRMLIILWFAQQKITAFALDS